MKLLAIPQKFGGEVMVRLTYGKEGLFFTGEPPAVSSLILIDLPDLKNQDASAVRAWLVEHNAGGKKRRKEDVTLHAAHWRAAVLDDFLVAANASQFVWHVAQVFTVEQITTFAEKHAVKLDQEIRAALATERSKRPAALAKANKRAELVVPILYAGQRRIPTELEELRAELDREDLAKLFKARKDDVFAWIAACADLRSDTVKRELITKIAKHAVKIGLDIGAVLDAMLAKRLDKVYSADLFEIFGHRVPLAPNVTGERIDLTKAREATVPATWATYQARRVGPVKIGRSALAIWDKGTLTYVRGERKLKHQIKKRGGSIQRWGNTLTIAAKEASSAHAALLRVDEIDSLAQLAPERAVALLPEPVTTGPIAEALAHAGTDPRWRRILADLLVERLVGIDADVARRLARAEARANRR